MALNEELKAQGDFLFRHRSFLPLSLMFVGICVKMYGEYSMGEANEPLFFGLLEIVAFLIASIGFLIRVMVVGYTPPNTSGRNTKKGQVAETLNTKGLYSLVRNPLYLGNYLMWLGISILTGNIWFVLIFSLVFWIYYERIVFAEEQFLRVKFGADFLTWSENTSPFLPYHLNYVKPTISFSWKKVLLREKNGLLGLFVVFLLFESLGSFARELTFFIEETWIIIGTIGSGILYLILKILKKYTSYLNKADR
jgi:protein-S-isoprenylcysteine O-methyltransferase Ste14